MRSLRLSRSFRDINDQLDKSCFQCYLEYTNKFLLSRPIVKGPNIVESVFLQLSNNCLNKKGIVNVLRNIEVAREIQNLIKQNPPNKILQLMDSTWGADLIY